MKLLFPGCVEIEHDQSYSVECQKCGAKETISRDKNRKWIHKKSYIRDTKDSVGLLCADCYKL